MWAIYAMKVKWLWFVVRLTHVLKELIAYKTWHWVMWLRWRRSRQGLAWWTSCKSEGQVMDLAPMDWGNSEEQVRSRSINQYGHMMIWSGSYHLWLVGACVASILEEMEWNAQGNGITYRAFHFTGYRYVEKFMTGFRIDGRTIKRSKLVCISVI